MTCKHDANKKYHSKFKRNRYINKNAFNNSLDIRKFEIDLYWKRATYFWTFIGATFAGYITLQSSSIKSDNNILLLITCLGMIFSLSWLCVNKGSKFWQENWENHVDLLEDSNTGPLYKTVISNKLESSNQEKLKSFFVGSHAYSVSKINQIISLYITILWFILIINECWVNYNNNGFSLFGIVILVLTINFCFLILVLGETSFGDKKVSTTVRKTTIY